MGDMFRKVAQVIKDNSVVVSILCDVFSPSTYKNEDSVQQPVQSEVKNRDNFPR